MSIADLIEANYKEGVFMLIVGTSWILVYWIPQSPMQVCN